MKRRNVSLHTSIRGWTPLWVSSVDEAGVRSHAVLSLRKISEKTDKQRQQCTLDFSQTNWSLDHKPVTVRHKLRWRTLTVLM